MLSRPWTRWVFRLVVALLAAEGTVRFLDPRPFAFVHQARQVHRYSRSWVVDLVPSSSAHLRLPDRPGDDLFNFIISVNAFGFRSFDRPRDHGIQAVSPTTTRYVHAIGDSYTMGWGVDYSSSYPAVLEWLLPQGFRVLNLGVDGYGTIAATEKSMALAPGFPIWHAVYLFSPNDFSDDHRALEVRKRSAPVHWAFEALDAVRRRSYLGNIPFAVKWGLFFRNAFGASALPPEAAHQGQVLSGALRADAPPHPAQASHPSLDQLDAYDRYVRDHGGQLSVLVLSRQPPSASVYWHCIARGIAVRVIEPPPAMQLRQDGHLNQVGNQSLAKMVREEIIGPRLAE